MAKKKDKPKNWQDQIRSYQKRGYDLICEGRTVSLKSRDKTQTVVTAAFFNRGDFTEEFQANMIRAIYGYLQAMTEETQ